MSAVAARREAIIAAIDAYNRAHPQSPLPRPAARLLGSKLILTILAGVATWEREIMLERQREGIAKAKAAGK